MLRRRDSTRGRAAEDVFHSENSCHPWDTLNFQPLLTRCGLNISWLVLLPCCVPTHLLCISFCCLDSGLPFFELHVTEACRTLRQALLLGTSMRSEIIIGYLCISFLVSRLWHWLGMARPSLTGKDASADITVERDSVCHSLVCGHRRTMQFGAKRPRRPCNGKSKANASDPDSGSGPSSQLHSSSLYAAVALPVANARIR